MNPQEKSKDQIKAEREAKKLAKALAKNKEKVKEKVEISDPVIIKTNAELQSSSKNIAQKEKKIVPQSDNKKLENEKTNKNNKVEESSKTGNLIKKIIIFNHSLSNFH